jgi:hypothetical protein
MKKLSEIFRGLLTAPELTAKITGNIRDILIICLVLIIFVAVLKNQHDRKSFVTGLELLNHQNDSLIKANKEKDKELQEEMEWRIVFEAQTKLKEAENIRLTKENKQLANKLANIPAEVANVSNDSTYKFLQVEAYPFEGKLEYPFNAPQIKAIHTDYLENIVLYAMIDTFAHQISNIEGLVIDKDSLNRSLKRSLFLSENQSERKDTIINNFQKKEVLYKSETKRLKRLVGLFEATTIIATLSTIYFMR